MSDKIESRYYFDKNGTLYYSENWYDTNYLEFSEYDDSLNAYSNLKDYSRIRDGENFNSIEELFIGFINDGQYNLHKLINKLKLTIDDYKDYTEVDESVESISDLTDDELTSFLTDWYSEYNRIPAWVFTDTSILSENHSYYSTSCSITNYSCAGNTYWNPDNIDEDEPDFVFWIDKQTFNDYGVIEDSRYDHLRCSIKVFENWANGYVFGLTTQTWDEQRDCWTEEDNIGGFLGNYYDIERLIEEDNKGDINYIDNLEDAHFDKKPFPVEMNNSILYERKRQKEWEDRNQLKLFPDAV